MRGLQTKQRDAGVNLLPDSEAPLLPEYPGPALTLPPSDINITPTPEPPSFP
jgi:hypothetical protein